MFRFPGFDLPDLDLSQFDPAKFDPAKFGPAKFGPAKFGPGAGGSAARVARMTAAMTRFQRAQAEAAARWAETQRTPAGPAAGGGATAGPKAGGAKAGGAKAGDTKARDTGTHAAKTLDMEAPTSPGGAWTAPKLAPKAAPSDAPDRKPRIDLSAMLREFRPAGATLAGATLAGTTPGGAAVPVPDGARYEARTFTGPAGSRSYKVYVPSGYAGQALPLVVMLHGCSQNPDDFAAGTRMNALAEAQTFLVAYPGQSQAANMQRCWNWYAAGDQARTGGEPELIAGIARAVIAEFSADPTRVYAAGLSAGGAAAAILAATYPDVFAAVGVHSGLACGAARDVPSAFAAMKGQAAVTGRNRQPVPTIVFHGDGDHTVHPANGDRVIAQAMAAGHLAETVTTGTSPGGIAYTRTLRSDPSGRPMLEQWTLHGAGHAWSGGSPTGSYTEPRGPDASAAMIRFFLAHRLSDADRA